MIAVALPVGGAGLGAAVKDCRAIFVSETPDAFNELLNSGWEAGIQASAAAKTSSDKGAYSDAIASTQLRLTPSLPQSPRIEASRFLLEKHFPKESL